MFGSSTLSLSDTPTAVRRASVSAPPHAGFDAVAGLVEKALRHRAVRHPYLTALGSDLLPDPRWAMADFARHYAGYSRQFPRFVLTVAARLDRTRHRTVLVDNLGEESGRYGPDELATLERHGLDRRWFDGVPHPELFRRFARSVGAPVEAGAEALQVRCWYEMLLAVLRDGPPAEAVGALGLGTESIVPSIYRPFVLALDRLDVPKASSVFFPLHTLVDDHHQQALLTIAADLATTAEGFAGLESGMLKALQLRSVFWDWLYERALNPKLAESVA